MQILNIILTIVAVITNATMAYFAVTAWSELRRMKGGISDMKRALTVVTTITMASHVRENFEQLNKMKATLHLLVQNEQYKEAGEMKTAIMEMERSAKSALGLFDKLCGDGLFEVVVTKGKAANDGEKPNKHNIQTEQT
ncbi:MAG: hypothetical protein J6Y33_03390 [Prevotella sp.]|nr:hypothetical protein [Prevotella sp.]